jgi:hypothetical protein
MLYMEKDTLVYVEEYISTFLLDLIFNKHPVYHSPYHHGYSDASKLEIKENLAMNHSYKNFNHFLMQTKRTLHQDIINILSDGLTIINGSWCEQIENEEEGDRRYYLLYDILAKHFPVSINFHASSDVFPPLVGCIVKIFLYPILADIISEKCLIPLIYDYLVPIYITNYEAHWNAV